MLQEFSSDLVHFGRNLKDFHGFHNKIADVIRNSIYPVLVQCNLIEIARLFVYMLVQGNRGILKALLVGENGSIVSPSSEIDQLGVLANLQALTGLCTDISMDIYTIVLIHLTFAVTTVDDDCNFVSLDSSNSTRLLLWRIQERSLLIAVVNKNVDAAKYRVIIEESLDLIEQGLVKKFVFVYYTLQCYCWWRTYL